MLKTYKHELHIIMLYWIQRAGDIVAEEQMGEEKRQLTSHLDRHIGARIRMRRKMLRMSQTELSSAIGVTFQQLQKYERGANRVSASALWVFSQRLGVSIAYFFEGLERSDVETGVPETPVFQLIDSVEGMEFAEALADVEDRRVRKRMLELLRILGGDSAPETRGRD